MYPFFVEQSGSRLVNFSQPHGPGSPMIYKHWPTASSLAMHELVEENAKWHSLNLGAFLALHFQFHSPIHVVKGQRFP